jgi:hypothetical protein
MAAYSRPVFPHRRNPDGTFGLICIECFATIATSINEADLEAAEMVHVCPGLNFGNVMHPVGSPPKGQK